MTVAHAVRRGVRIAKVGPVWLVSFRGAPITAAPRLPDALAACLLVALAADLLSPEMSP